MLTDYRLKSGITPAGKAQILRNYENALKSIGAEVMLKGSYYYVFRIIKDGMETWVKVDPGNYDGARYELMIVEREALVQEVVADAAALRDGIMNTGHMAVYGIYFDSGKSIIKSGSEKALIEIAKVLKDNASLNLYIVGHTDSDGILNNNMELSVERSHAVVNVLVEEYGINRSRLEAKGVGPLAPVSTNRTEEGKALNRRVELVEK
ncbi:MAG: OmpA family protein [Bacteroidetes bacterium]|nr:OmpA family protein [Bacteroidota bacterium]